MTSGLPLRILSAAFAVLAFAVPGSPQAAARKPARSCAAETTAPLAAEILRDCRSVVPDAAKVCRAEAPCDDLREAVRQACERLGGDAVPACGSSVDDEDDDDE